MKKTLLLISPSIRTAHKRRCELTCHREWERTMKKLIDLHAMRVAYVLVGALCVYYVLKTFFVIFLSTLTSANETIENGRSGWNRNDKVTLLSAHQRSFTLSICWKAFQSEYEVKNFFTVVCAYVPHSYSKFFTIHEEPSKNQSVYVQFKSKWKKFKKKRKKEPNYYFQN